MSECIILTIMGVLLICAEIYIIRLRHRLKTHCNHFFVNTGKASYTFNSDTGRYVFFITTKCEYCGQTNFRKFDDKKE